MMQFVRVKEVPAELRKDEYVISAPTFLEEVRACFNKRPRNEVMSINYLRELVAAVGAKYLPETFNAMTDVNVSYYKGTPCTSEVEANEMLLKLFKREYPEALNAFVEYHIKNRPNGTKTVFYLGTGDQAGIFLKLGFQEVLQKDLYKEEKSKKTVGKPAITKEEADKKSEIVV
jgi:hypothetical protein